MIQSSLISSLLLSLSLLLSSCQKQQNSAHSDKKIVAITQIIDHKALDQERLGFIAELNDAFPDDVLDIRFENAQGNIATATQIATKFISLKPALIFTLSTPSAQACILSSGKAGIPVVFSAVTDPLFGKLISTKNTPRPENVTGVSDNIPAKDQLVFIKKLLPKALRIGVLYNPGEPNSVVIVKDLEAQAQSLGLTLIFGTASKTSDVAAASQYLIGKVDVIFVPNDNTFVSSIQSVLNIGEKHKLPVIVADEGSFDAGALAMVGYDRFTLGKRAAQQAIRILKGEKASDIPILYNHPLHYRVNEKIAQKMDIILDESLLKNIQDSTAPSQETFVDQPSPIKS